MAFSLGTSSVELSDILSKVTEFDILSHYFGINSIPCVINSPLRADKSPSFGVYTINGKKMYWRDLANGEGGGTWDLLGRYWGLSYYNTLLKLREEVSNITSRVGEVVVARQSEKKRILKEGTSLEVKIREFKEHDLMYWESYGISLPWLKYAEIYPISHIIITKGGKSRLMGAEKYAYVYIERKDSRVTYKIYQPFSDRWKWINNHDSSVWDLWSKIPQTGDNLIITSSRKDALCIWENCNIPSVSLQAESYLPKPHIIQELKNRYKKIWVLYDNDFKSDVNHGRELGSLMAITFNLMQIEIPQIFESKDTSDLANKHGRSVVKQVIHSLINGDY